MPVDTTTPPAFEVRGLQKSFGAFTALAGADLRVAPGHALGLVGPNGSGKTTLINVASGVYQATAGSVWLAGREVTGHASHRLSHLGLNRTFQTPRPFRDLTVAENVAVVRSRPGPRFEADPIDFVGLGSHRGRKAASLTSGEQKLLDLARALASGPDVLLVDELGAGLSTGELDHVATLLRQLTAAGLALVVVEHLMGFLEQAVDTVVVLNAGSPIFRGTLREAVADQTVIDVFLGE